MTKRVFTSGKYKYSFETTFARKIPYCLVYIKINTSEKHLLFSLGLRFKEEKLLQLGSNPNNGMYNCIPGINGIVIMCPENRITNCVIQFISYLSKTQLNPDQMCGKGDYKKLESSLFDVSVKIVGKCKTFTKNCIDKSGSTKMENMMKSISSRTINDKRDVIEEKTKSECCTREYKCNSSQAVDIIVSYKNCPIIVSKTKDGINVECCCCCYGSEWKTYRGVLRGYLKAFKSQCGSYGKPAANDNGQKKWKQKCNEIFDGVNCIAEMITDVRGVKFSYSKQDELKQVDSSSVRLILDALK